MIAVALRSLPRYAHYTQKSVFKSIGLRFENLDLAEQLRLEKARVQSTSHDKSRSLASASDDPRQPVHRFPCLPTRSTSNSIRLPIQLAVNSDAVLPENMPRNFVGNALRYTETGQMQNQERDRTKGFGLGLAIVERLRIVERSNPA